MHILIGSKSFALVVCIFINISGFHTGFFVRGVGGDFVMLGTLRACPIEIVTLERL